MKINAYKNYSELYKTAAARTEMIDEGAKALSRLMKGLDDVAETASPAFRELIENVAESAKGIRDDTVDIFQFLEQLISEAVNMQQKIDSGELVQELRRAQDAFLEAERKRQYHHKRHITIQSKNKKLITEMNDLRGSYEKALTEALGESTNLRQTVSSLQDEVNKLTEEALQAHQGLKEAAKREADLIKGIDESVKLLEETGKRADEAESALAALRKEHSALTALYEKTLKEADQARSALEAAKTADAPAPVINGLKQAAEGKKAAADEIATQLTKGDAAAKQTLEQQARKSRLKTDQEGSPKSADPDTIGGAIGKGFREGTQEVVRDLASKGLAAVGVKALKVLGSLALFGFVGLPLVVGGTMLWTWWVNSDENNAREAARDFDTLLRDAYGKLLKVNFENQSRTYQIQQSYLAMMQSCFGLFPEMIERRNDQAFIQESALKIQKLLQQTELFLSLQDVYVLDLVSEEGWQDALVAIQRLDDAGKSILPQLENVVEIAREQQTAKPPERPGGGVQTTKRPAPSPDDKGFDVLGRKVYLSQYPELDPATRSAAPYLIQRVLLSPTGLSFWDPEGKWGGGYISNRGTISDQVIRHIRFFMNPRAVDSDWAYGPINNERKLKKFMRKNMPKAGRTPTSGYKSTRREYKRNKPRLANSSNINTINVDSSMKNKKNRRKILEKIASSTNRTAIFTENIEKYADSVSKEYYRDALRGLDDQYAKSYYTGLKSMYDQKLGGEKADYKALYQPHGGTGTEILESSHPKSVVISDAMGNGGLVENVLEQQRHDVGVALSTPTGNFRGKHANLVDALKKIANDADNLGYQENSKMVNKAVEDIVAILKANGTYK